MARFRVSKWRATDGDDEETAETLRLKLGPVVYDTSASI
jgi:hypothetical protein